ncbi:phosphoketolase family protein [Candidatus Saccharibacteria bacterium]|nr:phosphoketolase family protein [Candidatus Saccharibacteria bacterium]
MVGDLKTDINKYVRAADYLCVAQIFLQDNFLLERPLKADDIKPRLLGHWGTCPGINRAYAHLSAWTKRFNLETMFVLGPGHGFPALQANLFLENTLAKYYPQATQNKLGIRYIGKNFSWPYGFPSHASPLTPGVILEGGELGYSLSTSYGAALDNPNLIVACLIGDGEAETASLLASLNLNKLISPKTNGVVLPILHLNGYKISGPTVYGRMSDAEIVCWLAGLGYQPIVVSEDKPEDFDDQMIKALDHVHEVIQSIKTSQANGFFKLPFIVMRTKKGETGPKELDGQMIEGNYLSHQVILTQAKTDTKQRKMLESWLKSYKFEELFKPRKGFGDFVDNVLPKDSKRMGRTPYVNHFTKLELPELNLQNFNNTKPGEVVSQSMNRVGEYLRDVFSTNQAAQNFRFFSPDETSSNKLDAIFEATNRSWLRPLLDQDKYMSPDGRVTEILSENTLQGLMQGYTLTGRHAVMTSYEAFMPIVVSMVDQYLKFLEQSKNIKWRTDTPAATYILSSTGWRQDHNGFSHQNPGFISDMLIRPSNLVNVLLPIDDTSTLVATEFSLKSKNAVNIITAGKTDEPRWLTIAQARYQLLNSGAMIFSFASDNQPQIIVAAAGDYVSKEALYGLQLAKTELPDLRLRFVNISAFSNGAIGTTHNKLSRERFDEIFTPDKPIIFSFHGYPGTCKQILSNYTDSQRITLRGYGENGSTTTSFDMHIRNHTSRYDVAMNIFRRANNSGIIDDETVTQLLEKYMAKIYEHQHYIHEYGDDLPEVKDYVWQGKIK